MWTDDFYYEIKYISDGTTKGVAYIDNDIESTYREYSEETIFYICKERGAVKPKCSAQNESAGLNTETQHGFDSMEKINLKYKPIMVLNSYGKIKN
ncbi:MAG: hypothetical protein J6A95_03955 [Clostridia bacterium]|nr:hypothetical protein [Clostridia bacterium]